ncbi:MAG: FAD-binding and (Fe-S)-binding domain-containing protein, partial [Planctomycetota bacterium]
FVKKLVGDTTPACVVQPQDEGELLALVALARRWEVPLVPRGKSSSGYGGVLPTRGGIVVDFWRMREVLEIDAEAGVVKVEPGVVWQDLERRLAGEGLAARCYPSSAPTATIAGGLAQGGTGFGGYEFGWFRDSVQRARVVHFDGAVSELSGEDLDLVADAEGITGFITRIDLLTRPIEPERVLVATFPDADGVAGAVGDLLESGVPAWNLTFTNPEMGRLKNAMPPRIVHGEPVETVRKKVPEDFVLTCVFPESRRERIEGPFRDAVARRGGAELEEEEAREEWAGRYGIMMVKRLGPSLIPAEVVIPAAQLSAFLRAVEEKVKHLLVKEGVVINVEGREPEVAILGFIPHDERRFGFTPAYALSLTFLEAAKALGGRAYSTGLYFKKESKAILGTARVDRLRSFLEKADPKRLMNPDKVIGSSGLLGHLMKAASLVEPIGRFVGNLFRKGEKKPKGKGKHIPIEVEEHAYACAQCGYCVDGCDEFYGRGWESHAPRGKWFLLRKVVEGKIPLSQELTDRILSCTTCEMCNTKCPVELPIEPDWMTLRGTLIQGKGKATFPPFEMMSAALGSQGNIWAGFRKNRAGWVDDEIRKGLKKGSDTFYFAGCTASYVEQDIAKGTARLLTEAGVEFDTLGNEENCCGIPMLMAGKWEDWEWNLRRNVENFKKAGAKSLVTSCPACWLVWHTLYPQWCKRLGIAFPFETKHYAEVLAEQVKAGRLVFDRAVEEKVTWHDSCHMGRAGGIYEPPRELLKALPGVDVREMRHNRENALCCGSVLTLIKEPDVAAEIGRCRLDEAVECGADAVIAACPCCEFQLRVTADRKKMDVKVHDLAGFLARAKGFDMPDPHPEVLGSWAVFDAMIRLMTPEGFTDVMMHIFPQLA